VSQGVEGEKKKRRGDLEDIEHTIFHSELDVLTTIREERGEGMREGGTYLNFLFESLELSHVANELVIDRWHFNHQILETVNQIVSE
jgi:hypothetical protein